MNKVKYFDYYVILQCKIAYDYCFGDPQCIVKITSYLAVVFIHTSGLDNKKPELNSYLKIVVYFSMEFKCDK